MSPELFEQFVQHGLFLKNWSPKTVRIYRQSFSSFQQSLQKSEPGGEARSLSKAQLEAWIMWMRQRGLTAGACNAYIRSLNSYLSWLKEQDHEAAKPLTLLKEKTTILESFSDAQVKLILSQRPKHFGDLRLWTLINTLLDTGIRIEEALTLQPAKVELENLLLTVRGKGDKERKVPISTELRKVLFRYGQEIHRRNLSQVYFFCTRDGGRLSYRNCHRDILRFCTELGIKGPRISPHTFRHFFAVTYIRRGGDIYKLSRILGHSSISTSQIYLRSMGIETIGENHSSLSPLNQVK